MDIAYHTPPMKRPANNRNSRGFTMIEILVAIGILVILIGIVAYTVGGVIAGARKKETLVRMQSLTAMLSELEAAGGLKRQPGKMYSGQTPGVAYPTNPGDPPFDIWRDGDPTDNSNNPVPAAKAMQSPGKVSEEYFKSGIDDRARSAGVLNTQLVMGVLVGMPVNRSALERTSADALMKNPVADQSIAEARLGPVGNSLILVDNNQRRSALRPAIMIDAWNNPIIFVPAAGLEGVTFADHGTERHIINSTSVRVEETDIPNYRPPATARPFFASAGPDGDFTTGDDNVYSFEE